MVKRLKKLEPSPVEVPELQTKIQKSKKKKREPVEKNAGPKKGLTTGEESVDDVPETKKMKTTSEDLKLKKKEASTEVESVEKSKRKKYNWKDLKGNAQKKMRLEPLGEKPSQTTVEKIKPAKQVKTKEVTEEGGNVETVKNPKRETYKWSDVNKEGRRSGSNKRKHTEIKMHRAKREERRMKKISKCKFGEIVLEVRELMRLYKELSEDTEKEELLNRIYGYFKDSLREYFADPGTNKYIVFLVREGNEEIQQSIYEDMKEIVCPLSRDQYGNHLVKAFLHHGTPKQKEEIVTELLTYVMESENNEYYYGVLDNARSLITEEDIVNLRKVTYGPVFFIFKNSNDETLDEFLERLPNQKTRVLKEIEQFLMKCIETNSAPTFIFRDVFEDYRKHQATSEEIDEAPTQFLSVVQKNIDSLLTKEKSVILLGILDNFNINLLYSENIVQLILSKVVHCIKTETGMEILQKLVLTAAKKDDDSESDNIDVLETVSCVLLKLLTSHFDKIVSVPHQGGFDLALAILTKCTGDKSEVFLKVCQFFSTPKRYKNLRGSFDFLKQMVHADNKTYRNGKDQEGLLSVKLMKSINEDCIRNWVSSPGGTEAIKKLYKSKIESVSQNTKTLLSKLGGDTLTVVDDE